MDFFERTRDYHVLVIGDVMLDRYIRGRVERISPEAPVPVLHWQSSESRMGGAANVALNIRRLGAHAALMGAVGDDDAGDSMKRMLREEQIDPALIAVLPDAQTTVKTRVIGGHQHLLRIDEERTLTLSPSQKEDLETKLGDYCDSRKPDILILQDYNKGFLSPGMIAKILQCARERSIPVCVDPKDDHFFAYEGVAIFKPNLRELVAKIPFPVSVTSDSLDEARRFLNDRIQNTLTAITLSEHGIFIAQDDTARIYPTVVHDVVDVCGAGDAVIAVLALGYLMGKPADELALLANVAGGVVCSEVGVCPVDVDKMQGKLQGMG